jgi:histidine ammonia-lyase
VTELLQRVERFATVAEVVTAAGPGSTQELTEDEERRMLEARDQLDAHVAAGGEVYGVTTGFGPLASYPGGRSSVAHGAGLIAHLAVGQGLPLSPEATRLLVWLRLEGMKRGRSAVAPDLWRRLAALWNDGFTPVVPSEGSVSASGDLVPLAHAARAFAGEGEAWAEGERVPASDVLGSLGAEPVRWDARSALAFVNGTTAGLAVTCLNHVRLAALGRMGAALSGRIAHLLRVSREPFSPQLAEVRTDPSHALAAEWMRAELPPGEGMARALQEPYSLRCSPQVVGAVLAQLDAIDTLLTQEANGCSDNPVVVDGRVLHGGNFHAAAVGLCSDQLALCVHQLAYLAERQLAVLVDPRLNGGLPPLLAARPGATSGLAGVQIAASSFVARIRQLASPATLTAIPTNLWNQDHVPMALNGAVATADAIRLGWLVAGALALATNQVAFLLDETPEAEPWRRLAEETRPVEADRPLDEDMRVAAEIAERWSRDELERRQGGETTDALENRD